MTHFFDFTVLSELLVTVPVTCGGHYVVCHGTVTRIHVSGAGGRWGTNQVDWLVVRGQSWGGAQGG